MNTFTQLIAGTQQVIPQDELAKKLASGKKLIIKLGVDPTSPDLHLGHAVVLSKLKQFQDLGHTIVFLIGDFTARIGDPTGKSKTRPPLDDAAIAHNSRTYFDQVGRILDRSKIIVRYNSEWLGALSSQEWVTLCAKVTLARLIEREDFARRIAEHQSIGFHELLYPLMQGYDSVALHADVELGGTDQTFNLLVGRELQEHYGQEAQVIMTVPILPGLDGVQKMSKSLNNAIGLTEPADQAYGKIMSISDDAMWTYYEILLTTPRERLSGHPMVLKKQLAHALIAKFWGATEADAAQATFESLFQKRNFEGATEVARATLTHAESISLVELVRQLGAISATEARRLIQAGAISINGEKVIDIQAIINLAAGMHIKIGKHKFYTVV